MVGAGFLGNLLSQWSTNGSYDFWNSWFKVENEYIDLIDMLLTDDPRGKVGNKKIISAGRTIPDIGTHYYHYCIDTWAGRNWHYIKLEKKKEDDKEYYMIYVSSGQKETFAQAMRTMFQPEADSVRCIYIDSTHGYASLHFATKICRQARPNQTQILRHIYNIYSRNPYRNAIALVCGVRGSGKTYLGRLMKKYIENINNNNVLVRLFDNLNPSKAGHNVNKLILPTASRYTPVITLIDEINVSYREAFIRNERDSDKTIHTQNKQTLNEMFDDIADTKNVIAIYTTELSPQELYDMEDGKYRSFFRKGRVNTFIEMGPDIPDNYRFLTHDDIGDFR